MYIILIQSSSTCETIVHHALNEITILKAATTHQRRASAAQDGRRQRVAVHAIHRAA